MLEWRITKQCVELQAIGQGVEKEKHVLRQWHGLEERGDAPLLACDGVVLQKLAELDLGGLVQLKEAVNPTSGDGNTDQWRWSARGRDRGRDSRNGDNDDDSDDDNSDDDDVDGDSDSEDEWASWYKLLVLFIDQFLLHWSNR